MRWDPYLLTREDEFNEFWASHNKTQQRKFLLLLGRGFDVRTLIALKRLKALGLDLEIWQLEFKTGVEETPIQTELIDKSQAELNTLFSPDRIKSIPLSMANLGSTSQTPRATKRALDNVSEYAHFDDIIIDISAMPRMVSMSAVATLLYQLDELAQSVENPRNVNLHVVTAESVSADLGVGKGSLNENVTFVMGFSGSLEAETTLNWPRVWFPVLGEGQTHRLSKINDHINPDEICPVIPFPTRMPRRGDEIIAEHREILFDEFRVDPRNFLLASEYNPFEAYKQIFSAMERYRRTLKTLGGCKAFVSPLSSKLLSVGVLLACYDHMHGMIQGDRLNVGIPYVETAAYSDPEQTDTSFELYSMWIRGEWETTLEDSSDSQQKTEML